MLGPHDVGHRVVVRRRAGVRGDRPVFSDVLGELVDLTETDLTVRTVERLVRVPRTEITHAKRVPDRRRPTATEALERVVAAGWPVPDQAYLGEWLLRAADGWTARGNSALPIGDPGRTLNDAVDAVEAWYRTRNLLPKITVPEPVGGRITAELTRRGWTPAPPTLVQTAALADVIAAVPADTAVVLDTAPPDGWWGAVAGHKGAPREDRSLRGPQSQASSTALPDVARQIITGVPVARYAGVYGEDGSAIAIGRGVITDGSWLGVSLVSVDPAHRRKGLGRAIVGALARWAADADATHTYLQVEERNAAAVATYAPLGFRTHHSYVTWTSPA